MTKSASRQGGPAASSSRLDGPACEAALQTIARDCRADLKRHIRPAAGGDANSLHKVRIALTRLRSAIRFFMPAIDKRDWKGLYKQARWLSRHAGKARDLDVALAHRKGAASRIVKRWRMQRERRYEGLRTALRSERYRDFVRELTRRSAPARSAPQSGEESRRLEDFSISRLERWRRKLVRDHGRLKRMDTHKRHRLRMRAKRFKYALDWAQAVLESDHTTLRKQIEQAHVVQNALGKLNDGATHRAQAKTLKLAPLPRMARLDGRRSRRNLLQATEDALEQLERLKVVTPPPVSVRRS